MGSGESYNSGMGRPDYFLLAAITVVVLPFWLLSKLVLKSISWLQDKLESYRIRNAILP